MNTYRGTTTVSGGTLALAGAGTVTNSSAVDVAAGATFDVSGTSDTVTVSRIQTLKGTGTVKGTITAASVIDPGSATAAGTLTVQGDVSFTPESVYKADVIAGANDLLAASGDVALGNATLTVSGSLTNDSYVILSAAGTLSGTFNGLPGGATVAGASYAIHYRVAFFVWGPGIPAGADLYALNRQYVKPGATDRPDFNAPQQPIRNSDAPNLALSLLGLGAIPGSSLNADQGFGAVDSDGDGVSDNYERLILTDPTLKDTDGDGMNDGAELFAGTSPTDKASLLQITGLDLALSSGAAAVKWSSAPGRQYTLWSSANLLAGFTALAENLQATSPVNTYTNRAAGAQQMFYRVSVQP